MRIDSLRPASSDASFRRYFRVDTTTDSLIIMDAPPAHEDCRPFVDIATRLNQAGLNVPKILEAQADQGLLLLSDLGHDTFYQRIVNGIDDATLQVHYQGALQALVRMQQVPSTQLPVYDNARLREELNLFPDWYVTRHCNSAMSDQESQTLNSIFDMLSTRNAQQATCFVHRDYHSPNLMINDHPENGAGPGVIDFQDAVCGPVSYDLASLVMDARTTWEEPQQLDWAIRYWEQAKKAGIPVPADFADFHVEYEWMGLQRNLRILGVFARLSIRDGKTHYQQHMPRVNAYVRQVAARYNAFRPLLRLLDRLDNIETKVGYTF
ncbi:aminoglycoside phosphotransferase family protein [Advenella mimigardefordensis]|nr:phosphotransferase [Advenella mimigardefordensis]